MTAWCKSRRSQPLRFQLERLEQRITLGGLLRALMALCLGNDGDSDAIDDIAPPQYLNILGDPACVVRTISTGPADGAGYQVVVDAGPEPFVGNPATAADAAWAQLFDQKMRDPSVNVPTEVAAATAAREAPQEVPVSAPSLATPLVADQLFANPALRPQADQLPPDLARLLTAEAPSDTAPGEPADKLPPPASPTQAGAFSGAAMPGPEPTVVVSPPGEGAGPAAPATGPAGLPQGQAMREAVAGDGEGIDVSPADGAGSEATAALPTASQQPAPLLAIGAAALPGASGEGPAPITATASAASSATTSTIVPTAATPTTATPTATPDPSTANGTSTASLAALAGVQSQPGTPPTTDSSTPPSASGPTTAQAQNLLDNLPIRFEANQGQFNAQTQFVAHASDYDLYLGGTQSSFVFAGPTTQDANGDPVSSGPAAVVNVQLVGANAATQGVGDNELVTKTNYLIGNDQSQWVTNVANYAGAQFANVYNGINLSYYENNGNLEHDFVISPGANPNQIVSQFSGAQQLSLDAQGNLVIQTANGTLTEQRPVAYQVINGAQVAVASSFALSGDQVSFALGHYDSSQQLVIDPTWIFQTYLGGADFDQAKGIAVTPGTTPYVYVVGTTHAPWTPGGGAPAPTSLGATASGTDVFVAKMKADGGALLYLTYLIGNNTDYGTAIAIGNDGTAYFTGYTNSDKFIVPGKAGVWQPGLTKDPWNAFVGSLTPAGNAIGFATYFGGDLGGKGTRAYAIALDPAQANVYIAGDTADHSFGPPDAGADGTQLGTIAGRGQDAFVAKFIIKTGALDYCAYGGGDSTDTVQGIVVDQFSNVYITGYTQQKNAGDPVFPTTTGAFQTTYTGPLGFEDAFVAKIQRTPGKAPTLAASTLFDGTQYSEGTGIAFDPTNNFVYVVGFTNSPKNPGFGNTGNQIAPVLLGGGTGSDEAFVARFDTNLNPKPAAGSYFVYLNGSSQDRARAIALTGGTSPKVYVVGSTFSTTRGGFPNQNGLQRDNAGSLDAFVAMLDPSKGAAPASLVYSTFVGGTDWDNAVGVATDTDGNAYVAGYTDSGNLRQAATIAGFQPALAGKSDAFVVAISPNKAAAFAPQLAPIGNQNAQAGVLLTFTASATTWDQSAPTYALFGAPAGASINPTSGVFTWTPTSSQAPGSYTFLVVALDSDGRSDQQIVTVLVSPSGGGNPDLSGDTLATAMPVNLVPGVRSSIPATIGDGLYGAEDVDLFQVSLQAGQQLTADIDAQVVDGGPPLSNLDSYLRIFDTSGNQLAFDNDGLDPDTGQFSQDAILTYTAPTAGTYYVGISGNANTAYNPNVADSGVAGSTGAYLLKLTAQPLEDADTALFSSANPSPVGQSVTLTAEVDGSDPYTMPTGTVTFYDGSSALGSAPLDDTGVATFSTSTLSAGSHSLTAVYSGDSTYDGNTSAILTQVIGPATTSLTVSSSSPSAIPGQAVTFTATAMAPVGEPDGSVTFLDGTTVLGSGTLTLVNGQDQATYTTSALALGTHAITAVYGGDASFTASDASLSQQVSLGTSSLALSSSLNPSQPNQAVTFTADVLGAGGTPTGTVTFMDGTAVLGSSTLAVVNGMDQATYATAALASGPHVITAVYGGDSTFAAGSTWMTQTVGMNSIPTTTTGVSATSNPALPGQAVTFTAGLQSFGGTPDGSVSFFDGTTLLGSGTLAVVGGQDLASYTATALAQGTHAITAIYPGNANFAPSASTMQETVQLGSTTTTLGSSANPTPAGQPVTLTATVQGQSATPTGTVSFLDGATVLGTGTLALVNGQMQATFTTSSLASGVHALTAVYGGDSTNAVSSSSGFTQTIS